MGFFDKLKNALRGTREAAIDSEEIRSHAIIDEDLYEQLEEQLILADTGAAKSADFIERLRERVRLGNLKTGTQAMFALKEIIADDITEDTPMNLSGSPAVILVIGVNGVGKTTTIAKLAKLYKDTGKSVLLAAGDTFRAAAREQLSIWAERADVPIALGGDTADSAAVVFDAVSSAASKGIDLVICDTAGRLHNKKNLMEELAKICRVIGKAAPNSSLETLLVIDGAAGQNAIAQAEQFCDVAAATGVVITKLDGTPKGGAALGIKDKMGIPVRFIGVGEGIDDLNVFDAYQYTDALFD